MPAGIQETFSFTAHFSRRVEAGFTAGRVSSDGGALLLREADRKIGLLGRLASCFQDKRQQEQVEHPLAEMLRSASTGWRWAMKTSTSTGNCVAILSWECSAASASWKSRWPGRAR